MVNAREGTGIELCWRCVGLISERIEALCNKERQRHRIAKNSCGKAVLGTVKAMNGQE